MAAKNRTLHRHVAIASFLAALVAHDLARAEPTKAQVDEGRDRFKRGVQLFQDGDFRAALIEFNRANEIAPSFRIQYNIGQTCLELQDYACAYRAFGKFLGDGGNEVPKDRRQQTEHEIDRLKKLVATIQVRVNKDGADVSVDDVAVGRSPLAQATLVGAGRHKVTASLSPAAPVTKVIDVAGGDELQVALDLVDPAAAPVAPAPALAGSAPPPQAAPSLSAQGTALAPQPSRAPFWIGLATTTALAAGTAVTGVFSLSAQSDLDGKVGKEGVSSREVDDAQSKVQTFSLVTDVLLAATIVSAGITTVLWFTTSPPSRTGRAPASPSVAVTPFGAAGTF